MFSLPVHDNSQLNIAKVLIKEQERVKGSLINLEGLLAQLCVYSRAHNLDVASAC